MTPRIYLNGATLMTTPTQRVLEIARHVGPVSCTRLLVHVEAYTPEGTSEPLVSITLTPPPPAW